MGLLPALNPGFKIKKLKHYRSRQNHLILNIPNIFNERNFEVTKGTSLLERFASILDHSSTHLNPIKPQAVYNRVKL